MPVSARLPFVAGLLACAVFSQNEAPFRSQLDLVVIPCSVVEAAVSPVHGLAREDFQVFDTNVPRVISYFSRDDDQPVTLGIIIDESDSQDSLVNEHRRTALELLHRIIRPTDSAFVISVREDIRLYRDLTLTQMESFGEPCPKGQGHSMCGDSPLWNAVYDAARLKLRDAIGNKALLLLTDGFDTGSTRTWSQAAGTAQMAGTVVYAIQYRSSSGSSYAPDLYRLIAETAGTWFPAKAGELDSIVGRLETDLRRRYVIGFRPERVTLGKLRHEVRVEVRRPDYYVRDRKAYFEVPPPGK